MELREKNFDATKRSAVRFARPWNFVVPEELIATLMVDFLLVLP
jgi:hypothetical protein